MEIIRISCKDIDVLQWNNFIEASPQGGPFLWYEYMSIVAPDWQAFVVHRDGQWQAVMPINLTKKAGFTHLPQPPFTQYWGVCWAGNEDSNPYKLFRWKQQTVSLIAEMLAPFHLINFNCSPTFDYGLPFYWEKCSLYTRYTYLLNLDKGSDLVFQQMASSLKRDINKAKKLGLESHLSQEIEPLLELIYQNEQGGNSILSNDSRLYELLRRLGTWLIDQKRGYVLYARDDATNIRAGALLVHYQNRMYYLASAYDPEARSICAMPYLLWQAIVHAVDVKCSYFDFEGSMIQGIEFFFRKFGGSPIPYLQIQRNKLPLLVRWIHGLLY